MAVLDRSTFNLAQKLVIHYLKKPFRDQEDSLRQVKENYAADGLLTLTAEERLRLPAFETCLSCGLCDAMCSDLAAAKSLFQGAPQPTQLVYSTRLWPNLPLAEEIERAFSACGECRDCEAVCPTGVPLRELAAFIRGHHPSSAEPTKM